MKILTPRLEIVAATLEMVTADLHRRHELPALLGARIGAGWPPPLVDVAAMRRVKEALLNEIAPSGWGAWYVLLKSPRILAAFIGFKGKPANGVVELGYSVLEDFQRGGLGTEMVGGMAAWAFAHEEVRCVRAETLPELIASQRVLLKNGFTCVGGPEEGTLRFDLRRQADHLRSRRNYLPTEKAGARDSLPRLGRRRVATQRHKFPKKTPANPGFASQPAGGSGAQRPSHS